MMQNTTILKKLLKFIVPFLTLPFFIILVFIYLYFSNFIQKDTMKASESKVMQLSYVIYNIYHKHSKNHLDIGHNEIQLMLDKRLENNMANIITIINKNGIIINYTDKSKIGKIFHSYDDSLKNKLRNIVSKNDMSIFNYIEQKLTIKPLLDDNSKISTFIVYDYGYEISQRLASLQQTFIYLVFISLFITVISVIIIIIFSLNITYPLSLLMEGTQKIIDGNLDDRIEISSDDELEELSQQFNLMSSKLKTTINELKIKNENFEVLLDTTMEAIILSDENNKIIGTNQACVSLFKGDSKLSFVGRNLIEFVPDYEFPKLAKALQIEYDEPREYDLLKNDGTIFPVLASGRSMLMDGVKIRVSIVLDLTQIKAKDQQLIQQSRLAQMGEMISMIAHQWRQPLNAISLTTNNLQFKIMMDDIDKDLFAKEIKLIDKYSQHLSKTIDDFREFFKTNKEKDVTTLDKLVNDTLDIIGISIENKNIKMIKGMHCTHQIKTYSNEVKQVLLNIIKNAEDILIEKQVKDAAITIESICGVEHSNPTLIVRDNGGGIPEDIIDKIFDPYFSTKLEKEGTGLGLYMSKTIIEEHCGGKLNVLNDEDGAVFRIEFPEQVKEGLE